MPDVLRELQVAPFLLEDLDGIDIARYRFLISPQIY